MIEVSTMADLRSLPAGADASAYLLGYYEHGDGGDGLWVWRPDDTILDDGGSVIIPDGHSGPGRWRRPKNFGLNVLWFGARGDGVSDDLPAFLAAIDALGPADHRRGGLLLVPRGTYRLAGQLVIDRVMVLQGEVGLRNYASSELVFDDGYGIMVYEGTGETSRAGAHATLCRLHIRSAGDGFQNRPTAHGVHARAPIHVEDCFIVGFKGHGIFIDSGPTFPNCNWWTIHTTSCENCTDWGLWINGGNAQGGYSLGYFGMSNGNGHLGESSFLGNTHLAPKAHSALYPGVIVPKGFLAEGPANRSTIVGGYVEADCAPADIGHQCTMLGGNHGPGVMEGTDKGLRIIGKDSVSGFQVNSDLGAPKLQLGRNGDILSAYKDGNDPGIQLREAGGKYQWAGKPIIYPGGLYVGGPGATERRWMMGATVPTGSATAGDWIRYHEPPAGGREGLVCMRTGFSAPKWAPNGYHDAGEYCVPDPDGDWMYFKCIQTGYSGATQPQWPTQNGATVQDGSCIWQKQVGYSAGWRECGSVAP